MMPSLEDLANLPTGDANGDNAALADAAAAPTDAPTATGTGLTEEILAQDPAAKSVKRSESLAATRQSKMDQLFKDRHYTFTKEVNLPKDGPVFQTPLGNKGRNGYVFAEVDAAGNPVIDPATNKPVSIVLGATTAKIAGETYGAIDLSTLPKKEKKAIKEAPDAAPADVESVTV